MDTADGGGAYARSRFWLRYYRRQSLIDPMTEVSHYARKLRNSTKRVLCSVCNHSRVVHQRRLP